MTQSLMLHQETLLLALSDGTGKFSSGMYLYSVAGAMVSELMLLERIRIADDKQKSVEVLSTQPTGCEVLDDFLARISESSRPRGLQHWIGVATGIPKLNHRLAEQLCELGILKHDERKVLFLFTQQVYPELDGTWEDAIRARMADVMFRPGTEADVRTCALIALAFHADLLRSNFAKEELDQHRARIKELASGEHLASDSTKASIDAAQAAIVAATIIPAIMTSVVVNTSN